MSAPIPSTRSDLRDAILAEYGRVVGHAGRASSS